MFHYYQNLNTIILSRIQGAIFYMLPGSIHTSTDFGDTNCDVRATTILCTYARRLRSNASARAHRLAGRRQHRMPNAFRPPPSPQRSQPNSRVAVLGRFGSSSSSTRKWRFEQVFVSVLCVIDCVCLACVSFKRECVWHILA